MRDFCERLQQAIEVLGRASTVTRDREALEVLAAQHWEIGALTGEPVSPLEQRLVRELIQVYAMHQLTMDGVLRSLNHLLCGGPSNAPEILEWRVE